MKFGREYRPGRGDARRAFYCVSCSTCHPVLRQDGRLPVVECPGGSGYGAPGQRKPNTEGRVAGYRRSA